MYKATIIGHFGFGYDYSDGQTVKTTNLSDTLCEIYGEENICRQDTHGGLRSLLRAPFVLKHAFRNSENIIILPAYRGIRVYAPLMVIYKVFYRNRKIHYVVVGGWLYKFLATKPFLKSIFLYN